MASSLHKTSPVLLPPIGHNHRHVLWHTPWHLERRGTTPHSPSWMVDASSKKKYGTNIFCQAQLWVVLLDTNHEEISTHRCTVQHVAHETSTVHIQVLHSDTSHHWEVQVPLATRSTLYSFEKICMMSPSFPITQTIAMTSSQMAALYCNDYIWAGMLLVGTKTYFIFCSQL